MNPFWVGVTCSGLALVVALVYGILHWRGAPGKFVALLAGILLVGLAAWVALVLFLSGAARRGAPM